MHQGKPRKNIFISNFSSRVWIITSILLVSVLIGIHSATALPNSEDLFQKSSFSPKNIPHISGLLGSNTSTDAFVVPPKPLAYIGLYQNVWFSGSYNQISLILGIRNASSDYAEYTFIGENFTPYNGQYGNYTITGVNDSNFRNFTYYLSDNSADTICDGVLFTNNQSGMSGYICSVGKASSMLVKSPPTNLGVNSSINIDTANEPDVLKLQPDFAGYHITFVQLDIQSFTVSQEKNDQGYIGTRVIAKAIWEIWGYPIVFVSNPHNNINIYANTVALTYLTYPSTANVWYSLDNAINVTLTKNITLSVQNYGHHNITLWANDTAGNLLGFMIFFQTSQLLPALPVFEVVFSIVAIVLLRKMFKDKV